MKTPWPFVLSLAVAACLSPVDPNGAELTPAGGTIGGPQGAKVVAPAGAVTAAVKVEVAVVDTGFPTRPASTGGDVFALTPHGQQFDKPVTISIPAPASGTFNALLTAQPNGTWERVPGARRVGNFWEAEVRHFSYFVSGTATAASHPRLFIGDGHALRELDLTDGGVRTLFAGVWGNNYVSGVAADPIAQYVYWVDNGTDAVTRMPFAGGPVETLYSNFDGITNPARLAVDPANDAIFWAQLKPRPCAPCNDAGFQIPDGVVMRARLDGGGATELLVATSNANSTAVDPTNQYVYWTEDNETVNRVRYDGGGREILRTTFDAFANPRGIALDVAAGYMFFAEGPGVLRAALDGTGVITVFAGQDRVNAVTSIAVDPASQQLYWSDNGTDDVKRAAYDGSGQTVVYRSPYMGIPGPGFDGGMMGGNVTNPQGLAFVP